MWENLVNLIKWCYLASEMAETKKKKKQVYTGKNVRISENAFKRIKAHVDEKGLKLGRFVEDTVIASLNHQTK